MRFCDVNVLVDAFRTEAARHRECRAYVEAMVASYEAFAVYDLVLSAFVRLVTHPKVLSAPETPQRALEFVGAIRSQPNAVRISPGERHWEIFRELVGTGNVRGNLVPDAWLAALAIEHGCELVSSDSDFARFDGLRWSRPELGPEA